MGFDEWRKKKYGIKDEEDNTAPTKSFSEWQKEKYGVESKEQLRPSDYAPVKQTEDEDKKWYQKIFKGSDAFDDGWQAGDLTKTILSSGADLGVNIVKGAGRLVEGVTDLASHGVAGVADLFGADEFAETFREEINKSAVDRIAAPIDDFLDDNSIFGDTGDAIGEGLGQVAAIILTGGVAAGAGATSAGVTALTTGLVGASSMGSGISEAYSGGATDGEAFAYGLSKGVIDAGTELLFGGLGKAVNALGVSRGISSLDDVFASKLSSKLSSQFAKNMVQFGVKSSAEGFEEVLAGLGSAVAKKLTYMSDEELTALVKDENLMEQFAVGAITSGISQSGLVPGTKKGSLREANKTGRDFVTGLTQNEQKVFDKVYEDAVAKAEEGGKELTKKEKAELYDVVMESLQKGGVGIDTIEGVLGGDDYKAYKEIADRDDAFKQKKKALQEEFDTLNKMKVGERTGEQTDRLEELRGQIKELDKRYNRFQRNSNLGQLKSQLSENVQKQLLRQNGKKVQADNYLIESYKEEARSHQAFEVDLDNYDGDDKTKEILKNLMEKKQVNNTRAAHEFWEYAAKSVAERGGNLISADTEEILEMARKKYGNEYVEKNFKGKRPNAFVLDDGTIAINVKSTESRRFLLGHEIMHTLEGSEHYDKLKDLLLEYDKRKTSEADQKSKQKATEDLYEGIMGAEADKEYIADLVGKYIYDDVDFIHHLSTKDQNLFQKVWDWVKHQYKLATAGSKEQRDLLRIKREFEKAYRENIKNENKANGKTDFSLSVKETNGTEHIVNPLEITRDEILDYMDMSRKGLLEEHTYFPVSAHIPNTIISTLQNAGIGITDKSLAMQAKKAKQSQLEGTPNKKDGIIIRHHALKAEEILEAIDKLNDPGTIIQQTERTKTKKVDGKKVVVDAPDNFAVFVTLDSGKECVAVIEFDSEIDPKYIVKDGKGEEYHTTVTVFEPDVLRNGLPFDYVEYLLLKKSNRELDIKKESHMAETAYGETFATETDKGLSNPIIPQNSKKSSGSTKLSLSSDSEGKQLTKEQSDYFKDSKMRDENGNLKVMYHGSQDAGFHVFDPSRSDDDTSLFFVDRNDVAASYSGTSETYEAKTIRTAEDMNNFLAEIGYDHYEAVEKNGKFELLENNEHVAYSDTAQGIYEEFCWYEGVGEGDANYKVYLNLTNPLEVDAEGRNWNNISREYSQEVADRYNSLTTEEKEALHDLTEWGEYGVFKDEMLEARAVAGNSPLASAYEKLGGANANLYDAFSIAQENFSDEAIKEYAVKQMNTRDYAEKAKAEGYDGVIFKNIHDNGGYSNGSEGASTVAIAFNSNQIKSVANEKPTGDPDIRFSLSKSVEETKDLVALHNVRADKLMDAFKLGGLPSPSVAITKSDILHDNYGDITLLLRKDAIDPQADSRNKVYGSDAWTPTISNARTEYEVDTKKARAFEERLAELSRRVAGGAFVRESVVRGAGIDDVSDQDAKRLSERLANYDEVRAAYLADIGKTIEPEYKAKVYNKFGNKALQTFIDRVGVQHLATLAAESKLGNMDGIRAEEETVRKIIRDTYAEEHAYSLNRRPDLKEKRIDAYMEKNVYTFTIEDFVLDAWEFYQDGGAVTEEIDRLATSDKLRQAVNDSDVRAWLEPQIAEFLGEPGIYNGKDVFFSDGRRRSFAATHYTYTAENIVKAMQNAPARGSGTFGAHATSLIATATPSYQSIAEMHADKGRLKIEDQATYDNILRDIDAVLESVEHDIMRTTKHHADNTFDEEQIIGSIITEAATGKRTVEAVQRAFAKDGYRISTEQAKKILALYDQAARVPTGYFEAKPERVVGFDEVAAFIIPNNADVKLKQELLNRGYAIAEYDPDVEGSRQKVVNSFEEYKFSLSDVNAEPIRLRGDGAMSDTYLAPTQEDIAPIREDVAENATTTPTVSKMEQVEDDLAPVAEVTEESSETPMEQNTASAVPENYAPMAAKAKIEDKRKITTVEERLAEKLGAVEIEIKNNIGLRDQSNAEFDAEIAKLKAEYGSKKNKNTKVANDILRRIERLQRMKTEINAQYEKRISDLEQRAERMNTPEYKTAAQRAAKQEEYTKQMEELVGDTSTWVDKKMGLSYKINTLRRNLRDIVRDKNGNRDIAKADAIYDELQGKYNQHEASLNRESNSLKKPYADMNITKEENEYIQMLGELRHNPDTTLTREVVNEFYEKNKNNIDTAKVDKAIEMARETYDTLLERVNEVLREQGMKEIPYRQGYFPHFTEEKQGFLARLFNWKTQNNDIPTDIAGLTEQFNPNRSWQSFNKQRTTDTTDYNFLKGLDTYVHGALDWIYHIEDIQKRRALENHIRYVHSEKGVKDKIDAIRKNETYDADEMQEQIDLVYREAGNPLNNFVTDLRAGTNRLANKKSSMDRGMEEMTNRKVYSVMTNISNRVTANMVAGSVSSALTNFIPITQSWGEVSPLSSLRAMGDTIKSIVHDDGMVDKSDFLTNRLRKEENLYKTNWDKVGDKIGLLMEGIDNFSSQTVWRSKYLENINKGMSESEAIKNADQFAENVIAGRSRGNNPTIFDSKNPVVKMLTAFQLEVNNQYGYMFKDMPQDVGTESKAKLVKGYAAMFIGAFAYNALYSSLTGRDAAFDPINIVKELLEDFGLFGDDEEEEPTEAFMNLAENVLEETPFVGGLLGGGRIPISSALPYDGNIMELVEGTANALAGENVETATKEWLKPVWYIGMPMGGGQIKKTYEGLSMFSDEHPIAGSYTDSGNLRFPVEDTFGNRMQAALFGQWASKNARDYFDNERKPLNEKQIQEYINSDLPIAEYWDYREGLSGLDTLAEKADYINDLDFPIDTKNQFINNIANRKEDIDLTDYDDYGSFEEFDYAQNSPEKYAFLQENGVSYEEYDSFDEDSKKAWSWAFHNPEKYKVSKAIADDVVTYRKYATDLYEIKADKDSDGNSIRGSRKEKVLDYINNLEDTEYGERIILYKTQYKSDNTYNADILEYLNSRNDLTYEERIAILKELGYKISSDGNTASWD